MLPLSINNEFVLIKTRKKWNISCEYSIAINGNRESERASEDERKGEERKCDLLITYLFSINSLVVHLLNEPQM